jgi:hypothetical protein
MKGDVLPPIRRIFPNNSGSAEGVSRSLVPSSMKFVASHLKIGYLLPFCLENSPSREDFYRSNVAIQEEAT